MAYVTDRYAAADGPVIMSDFTPPRSGDPAAVAR